MFLAILKRTDYLYEQLFVHAYALQEYIRFKSKQQVIFSFSDDLNDLFSNFTVNVNIVEDLLAKTTIIAFFFTRQKKNLFINKQ